MSKRKILNILVLVSMLASLIVSGSGLASAQNAPSPLAAAKSNVVAAPGSPTDETKIPHYFGSYPNWANSPFTLQDAIVTITPPSVPSVPVSVGNPLIDRASPSDSAANVFVVNTHAPLTTGDLTTFETWAQAGSGPSTFNAYVLRPDPSVANLYTVVFDSGPLSVPDTATGLQTFALTTPFAVQAGDLIAHYGRGIPFDTGLVGSPDTVFYPADTQPTTSTSIDVVSGDATFPLCSAVCVDRTYSIAVNITPPALPEAGAGATATVAVGANGAITGITITDPGSGYTADPNVTINSAAGTNTSATAVAHITTSGIVTSINVDAPSAGYTAPIVNISGGGATTDATATAYGGVDVITLDVPGSGYTFPTVEFDMPDGPNGVIAKAHAVCLEDNYAPATAGATVTITGVSVDDPGSGYSAAPNVRIHNGTLYDPIACNPAAAAAARVEMMKSKDKGRFAPDASAAPDAPSAEVAPAATAVDCGAMARATLAVQSVTVNTYGAGYTSAPTVVIGDPIGFTTQAHATAMVDVGGVTSIDITNPGSGYITGGGIKKFQDGLPLLCNPSVAGSCDAAKNNLGQTCHLPCRTPRPSRRRVGLTWTRTTT